MRPTVTEEPWGTLPGGEAIQLFTLDDGYGLEARIASYGATLTTIRTPDRNGRIDDVLLGFDTLAAYCAPALQAGWPFLGSTVGRFANRIAGARFSIDGTDYSLVANEGPHQLHGGPIGFDRIVWHSTLLPDGVRFTHRSPAGDQGFPGALAIVADIIIDAPGEMVLRYEATTDAPTHVNLTSHGYFNLAGRASRSMADHVLTIAADQVLAIDEAALPLAPMPVSGTPFDLRRPTRIGDALAGHHPQLAASNGFNHCFMLEPDAGLKHAATLHDPASGRRMEILTTEPGIQLYTANNFDGQLHDDAGRPLIPHQALCLETQHFPDSPNRPEFPSTLLRPGSTYRSETRLRFSIA